MIYSFFIFLLGLIIGSFLNVVICRYNTGSRGWRVLGGRSKCFSCNKTLAWYELIPVLSYLIQGARCRSCGSKISWQYPAVELLSAVVFVLIWLLPLTLPLKALYFIIFSILIAIAGYDIKHQIIPDGLVYAFVGLGLLKAFLVAGSSFNQIFLHHVLAGLGLAAFFWLLWFLSYGRWLGFGDGKLVLGVGFFLGPAAALSAIILAFWIGAAAGLLLITSSWLWRGRQSFTIKSELAFAPFIILGFALVALFNLDVLALFQI